MAKKEIEKITCTTHVWQDWGFGFNLKFVLYL